MDIVEDAIGFSGDWLWTWIVLPIVAVLGVYFTIRSGVVQFRLIPEMFRILTNETPQTADGKPQSVSAFGAFTISAASRVGVGNIAGVGTAIAIGGPGAVFWMWTMAFIGGASSFVESTLGQLFKVRDADGFRGGPAYYLQKGLKARWLGIVFAVILIVCFPFAFSSLQANTISATVSTTIAPDGDAGAIPVIVGVVLAALTALVVFGGVRRIASVTQAVVPLMALLYLLLGLVIVVMHAEQIPSVFASIYTQAFGPNDVLDAALGTIIMLLSVIVFLLAFSSILGNYYYGESNIEFITTRRAVLTGYRALVVVAIFAGSVASAGLVWSAADGIMGLMAIVNLVAIALLSGLAFRLLRDYLDQRRTGLDPVFTRARMPDVTGIECWEDELSVTGPIPVAKRARD